jgi:uncharacterized protein
MWMLLSLCLLVLHAAHARDPDAELLDAVREGDTARVAELLQGGADPDAASVRTPHAGKTALMWAAEQQDPALVDLLLRYGADASASNPNGGSALMYAAVQGNYAVVERLLAHGADVNGTARNGWSALMLAGAKSHLDVVRLLIGHGADVDATDVHGWTPLMRAVEAEDEGLVALLLRKGADAGVRAPAGIDAGDVARKNGSERILRLLEGAETVE